MFLAHCMHRQKKVVWKSDVLKFSCMSNSDLRQYQDVRTYFMSHEEGNSIETIEQEDYAFSFDSQDEVLGDSSKTRTNVVRVEKDIQRYHIMLERFQRINKLCEGRTNVYERMMEHLDEMEIEAMDIIQSTDDNVQRDMELNNNARIVSSNAPIECTPNRGRYKSAYERRRNM